MYLHIELNDGLIAHGETIRAKRPLDREKQGWKLAQLGLPVTPDKSTQQRRDAVHMPQYTHLS